MKTTLTALLALLQSLNPGVASIVFVGATFTSALTYINTLWVQLFSRLDAISAGSFGAVDFSPLGLINYVIPLDTLLTLVSAYITLLIACTTIRMIKAFVPTIS